MHAMLLMATLIGAPPAPVDVNGMKATPPAGWNVEKPERPEIVAQYRVDPVGSDKDATRIVVSKLPAGDAGDAAALEKAWRAAMLPPQVKGPNDAVRSEPKLKGTAPAVRLDLRGDFRGEPPSPDNVGRDYRLVGYHVGAPGGRFTVRILGPADTVAATVESFDAWVKAFE